MPLKCYISTDNEVTVVLTWSDDEPANNAVVEVELTTKAGVTLSGSEVTLSYTAASDGEYVGIIPNTVVMEDGITYYLLIVAEENNKKVTMRIPFKAGYYDGSCAC